MEKIEDYLGKILSFIGETDSDVSIKTLEKNFNIVSEEDKNVFSKAIDRLLFSGFLIPTENDRYDLIDRSPFVLAKVVNKHQGYVFVKPVRNYKNNNFLNQDFKLSGRNTNVLLVNDLIYIELNPKLGNSCKYAGYLKLTEYIKGNYLIINDEQSLKLLTEDEFNYKINVVNNTSKAKANDLVLARITHRDYYESRSCIVLDLVLEKVLVDSQKVGSDISNIILSYDYPIEFNHETIKELDNIPDKVFEADLKGRKDYTNEVVVTIDGEDALDFDDAISIHKYENGSFKLCVHIADVSSYVKENTSLDDEAFSRGNSIYVADRVVPMLPTKLSNGICSLNPNVIRLTMSVEMLVDSNGYILKKEVFNGFIKSYARLTYKEVNEFIQSNFQTKLVDEKVEKLIKEAYECAKIIRAKRENNFALKIETDEIKFSLDEQGQPVRVNKRIQQEGEKLIEDFMIVTNVSVAELLKENNIPTLYRVHQDPPESKIDMLRSFLRKVQLLKLFPRDNVTSETLTRFLENIEDSKIRELVSIMVLRSLAKAKYSTDNIGHFGLNEENYLHFTSPIRRYPDLIVHRCIKDYLFSKKKNSLLEYESRMFYLDQVAQHTSETERLAQQIEYDVLDLETCKYLSKRLGYKYHATIDGFNQYGFFIKLDVGLEGFLPYKCMDVDDIIYHDHSYNAYSKILDKEYNFGDQIDVVVLYVDLGRRKVDFCTEEYLTESYKNMDDSQISRFKKSDLSVVKETCLSDYQKFNSRRKERDQNNHKQNFKNNRNNRSSYKQSRSFSKNKERRHNRKEKRGKHKQSRKHR